MVCGDVEGGGQLLGAPDRVYELTRGIGAVDGARADLEPRVIDSGKSKVVGRGAGIGREGLEAEGLELGCLGGGGVGETSLRGHLKGASHENTAHGELFVGGIGRRNG